jgi:hypothetical protein
MSSRAALDNDTSGKQMLKQLREERHAAQAQRDYEFNAAARENYEHGRMMRVGNMPQLFNYLSKVQQ